MVFEFHNLKRSARVELCMLPSRACVIVSKVSSPVGVPQSMSHLAWAGVL